MSLAKLLNLNLGVKNVILVGVPEITNILDSDGKPYYAAKLKDAVIVRCSVDPEIVPFEAEEVYLREDALNLEGWKLIDPAKPEEGFFMEGWVVDFSKGQQIPLYQAESIRKWAKESRGDRRAQQRDEINNKIRERIAARAAK